MLIVRKLIDMLHHHSELIGSNKTATIMKMLICQTMIAQIQLYNYLKHHNKYSMFQVLMAKDHDWKKTEKLICYL